MDAKCIVNFEVDTFSNREDLVRAIYWAKVYVDGKIQQASYNPIKYHDSDPPNFVSVGELMKEFSRYRTGLDVVVKDETQRDHLMFWLDVHKQFVPPLELAADALPLHALDQLYKELSVHNGRYLEMAKT